MRKTSGWPDPDPEPGAQRPAAEVPAVPVELPRCLLPFPAGGRHSSPGCTPRPRSATSSSN